MKKFKILSLLLAMLATVSFTSCVDDDDDSNSGLTPAEIQQAYSQMQGSHAMKIYIVDQQKSNSNTVAYADSADVTLTVSNDSMMTIRNFPVRMLAKSISDEKISKALETAENKTLSCYTLYYRLSPVTFLINPLNLSTTVEYDGAQHEVTFGFLGNNYYSYGAKYNNNIGMQLYAVGYKIDSQPFNTLSSDNYGIFHITSK